MTIHVKVTTGVSWFPPYFRFPWISTYTWQHDLLMKQNHVLLSSSLQCLFFIHLLMYSLMDLFIRHALGVYFGLSNVPNARDTKMNQTNSQLSHSSQSQVGKTHLQTGMIIAVIESCQDTQVAQTKECSLWFRRASQRKLSCHWSF